MWMNYLHLFHSYEDLTNIQEENKTPPTKAKDDDCQSPPTKTFLIVKEMKEALITSNNY